jgi:peptidoglycan hydrolase-like protein with peptidoglycan-binding domain
MLDPTLRTPTSIESIIATVQNKAEDTLIASTTPVPVKKPVDIITVTPSILPSTEIALDQQLIDAPFAIGSSSFAIIDLQKDLTASGYYASDITGIYDEITHQAWLASRQTKK